MARPVRHLMSSLVIVSFLVVAAPPARAAVAPRPLAELGRESTLIVQGRVTGLRSARNADQSLIYTYVTMQVDRAVKGRLKRRTVRFRVMGGAIGDLGLRVPGSPVFRKGEEAMVLLAPDEEGILSVHGWAQGKQPIRGGIATNLGIPADDLAGIVTGALPGIETASTCSITCDPTGTPILTWPLPAMGKPIIINPAPMDGCTQDEWMNAVAASIETWNDVFADFVFTIGGTGDLSNRGKQPDGNNVVFVGHASSSLAYTTIWFNIRTGEIMESDTVISVDKNSIHWSCDPSPQPGKYDVQSAVTHELGHFLFLDDITESGCRDLTMYGAQYWNNIEPRTLEAADLCGIKYLYP